MPQLSLNCFSDVKLPALDTRMRRINRRDFLGTSAASLLIASNVQPVTAAAWDAPLIGLGFSLYGMKSLKTVDALRACAEIGYDGVELALMPGWPAEPKLLSADDRRELRKLFGDRGLALPALMENLNLLAEDPEHKVNLDRLKAAADLGHALAPDRPPIIETVLGGKPALWESVRERMADRLKAWAETAAAANIVLAVKPHVGGALHTPEGAAWLIRQVGSRHVRLAFDYSHFQLRGLPLKETVAALVPDSVFIHVKDARGDAAKFEFLLPGEADNVDYAEYLKLVQSAGYRGFVTVEVSGMISGRAGYDPLAAARKSYAHLAPAFEKARLRKRSSR